MRHINVAGEVREQIGHDATREILQGPVPREYTCPTCRRRGDTARHVTNIVVYVAARSKMVAAAHYGCMPSRTVRVGLDERRSTMPDPRLADAPKHGALLTAGVLPFHRGQPQPYLLVEPASGLSLPEDQGQNHRSLFASSMRAMGLPLVDDLVSPQPTLRGWAVMHGSGSGHTVVLCPDRHDGYPRHVFAEGTARLTPQWNQLAGRRGTVLLLAGIAGAARARSEDERIWLIHQAAANELLTGAEMLTTSSLEKSTDRGGTLALAVS